VYWTKFTAPNGERIYQSTGTKDKKSAQEFHDKLKAEMWRIANLGEKPKYLWQDAATRWIREMCHKRTIKEDKRFLCWFHDYLYGKRLVDIDKKLINNLIEIRQQQGATNATVNRYFTLLRAVLNRAKGEWEWIDVVPKIRRLKEPPARDRILSPPEMQRLLNELPEHTHDMCVFALTTGLRSSNVAGMKWSKINLEQKIAWVDALNAKAGKPIGVPLNEDAMAVLARQKGKHGTYVFTYQGNPIKYPRASWDSALKRAGIEDFKWHDLRHTWATGHAVKGTPLQALKKLGGWASWKSMERYIHLCVKDIEIYTENAEISKSV
jgi:integrase